MKGNDHIPSIPPLFQSSCTKFGVCFVNEGVTIGNITYHWYFYQVIKPLTLKPFKRHLWGFRHLAQDGRPITPLYGLEVLTK